MNWYQGLAASTTILLFNAKEIFGGKTFLKLFEKVAAFHCL